MGERLQPGESSMPPARSGRPVQGFPDDQARAYAQNGGLGENPALDRPALDERMLDGPVGQGKQFAVQEAKLQGRHAIQVESTSEGLES
jgi:hypothetical protein